MTAPLRQPLAGAGVEVNAAATTATVKAAGIIVARIQPSLKEFRDCVANSSRKLDVPDNQIRPQPMKAKVSIYEWR
jgi:hypothetical protein